MTSPSDLLTGLHDALRDASAGTLASAVAEASAECDGSVERERALLFLLTDFALRVAVPAACEALAREEVAALLRGLSAIDDTASAIAAREAIARMDASELVQGSTQVLEAALWADGAVAAQTRQGHPFAARVDAQVRAYAFSSPLDIPYFEWAGNALGDLLAAAVARAPYVASLLPPVIERATRRRR